MIDERGNTPNSDQAITGGFRIQIHYRVREPIQSAYVMCAIRNHQGVDVIWTYDGDTEQFGNRRAGYYLAEFSVSPDVLTTGRYFVRCAIVDTNVGTVHYPGIAFSFFVEDTDSLLAHRNISWPGMVRINPSWSTSTIE